MKVLHLLASGHIGGIEMLCKDYSEYSKNNNVFLFIWNTGCITEEMKSNGANVIELHARKKNIFGPLKYIYSLCKKEGIEAVVVHHTAPVAHFYLMAVKKKYPQIMTIAYAHENAEDMRGGAGNRALKLRKWLIRKSFQKANRVVAISKSVRDSLIDLLGVDNNKIDIVYNGININRFCSDSHNVLEQLEIIYVGRLIPQKGVQVTLKALTLLPENIKYRFRIVGEGTYREELQKLVEQYNLSDKVEFLGNRRDIPNLLSESDLFVHMPIWEEGFGITIVEAMAAGLLCVCARNGAVPELIDNGINGFVVEANNPEALKNVISNVSKNIKESEIGNMRHAAVLSAQGFSIDIFSSKLDAVIENVIHQAIAEGRNS